MGSKLLRGLQAHVIHILTIISRYRRPIYPKKQGARLADCMLMSGILWWWQIPYRAPRLFTLVNYVSLRSKVLHLMGVGSSLSPGWRIVSAHHQIGYTNIDGETAIC